MSRSRIPENEQRGQEGQIGGSGWFAAPNAIFEADLDPHEIAILLNLYRRAGPDGTSFPSYNRIAEDCGMSRSTAIRKVQSLMEKGWIQAEHRRKGQASTEHTSNLYHLQHRVQFEADRGVVSERHQGSVRETPGGSVRETPGRTNQLMKDKTREGGGVRGCASTEQPSPTKDETAVTVDDEEGKDPPSPQLRKTIKQIKPHLTANDNPQEKHLRTLRGLLEKHGAEELEKIITFAFDEFFSRDSWMKEKPRTWGTVTHCLPDAAATWENRIPIFQWSCPECEGENSGKADKLNGRRGLICRRCGTAIKTEQGEQVGTEAKAQQADNPWKNPWKNNTERAERKE